MWPHERLNCGEEYEEHWGKKPPEHIAELAFASRDDVQNRIWRDGMKVVE